MNITVEITLDRAYYEGAYHAWAAQKWLRRAEPYLAVAMILVGLGLRYFDTTHVIGIVPYLFVLAGLYEFASHFHKRHKWMQARLGSKLLGHKVCLEFGPISFKSRGPFTSGEVMWTGIQQILQAPTGLLLIPQNGINIFLPTSAFATKEQYNMVASAKINSR